MRDPLAGPIGEVADPLAGPIGGSEVADPLAGPPGRIASRAGGLLRGAGRLAVESLRAYGEAPSRAVEQVKNVFRPGATMTERVAGIPLAAMNVLGMTPVGIAVTPVAVGVAPLAERAGEKVALATDSPLAGALTEATLNVIPTALAVRPASAGVRMVMRPRGPKAPPAPPPAGPAEAIPTVEQARAAYPEDFPQKAVEPGVQTEMRVEPPPGITREEFARLQQDYQGELERRTTGEAPPEPPTPEAVIEQTVTDAITEGVKPEDIRTEPTTAERVQAAQESLASLNDEGTILEQFKASAGKQGIKTPAPDDPVYDAYKRLVEQVPSLRRYFRKEGKAGFEDSLTEAAGTSGAPSSSAEDVVGKLIGEADARARARAAVSEAKAAVERAARPPAVQAFEPLPEEHVRAQSLKAEEDALKAAAEAVEEPPEGPMTMEERAASDYRLAQEVDMTDKPQVEQAREYLAQEEKAAGLAAEAADRATPRGMSTVPGMYGPHVDTWGAAAEAHEALLNPREKIGYAGGGGALDFRNTGERIALQGLERTYRAVQDGKATTMEVAREFLKEPEEALNRVGAVEGTKGDVEAKRLFRLSELPEATRARVPGVTPEELSAAKTLRATLDRAADYLKLPEAMRRENYMFHFIERIPQEAREPLMEDLRRTFREQGVKVPGFMLERTGAAPIEDARLISKYIWMAVKWHEQEGVARFLTDLHANLKHNAEIVRATDKTTAGNMELAMQRIERMQDFLGGKPTPQHEATGAWLKSVLGRVQKMAERLGIRDSVLNDWQAMDNGELGRAYTYGWIGKQAQRFSFKPSSLFHHGSARLLSITSVLGMDAVNSKVLSNFVRMMRSPKAPPEMEQFLRRLHLDIRSGLLGEDIPPAGLRGFVAVDRVTNLYAAAGAWKRSGHNVEKAIRLFEMATVKELPGAQYGGAETLTRRVLSMGMVLPAKHLTMYFHHRDVLRNLAVQVAGVGLAAWAAGRLGGKKGWGVKAAEFAGLLGLGLPPILAGSFVYAGQLARELGRGEFKRAAQDSVKLARKVLPLGGAGAAWNLVDLFNQMRQGDIGRVVGVH